MLVVIVIVIGRDLDIGIALAPVIAGAIARDIDIPVATFYITSLIMANPLKTF